MKDVTKFLGIMTGVLGLLAQQSCQQTQHLYSIQRDFNTLVTIIKSYDAP